MLELIHISQLCGLKVNLECYIQIEATWNFLRIISKLVDDPERIQGVKDSGVQVKC